MQFYKPRNMIPLLLACFFLASCMYDDSTGIMRAFDSSEPAETETDELQSGIQGEQGGQADAASITYKLRIPQTKAELIASLEELYTAYHVQEVKISRLQDSLEEQKNEIISLRKSISELLPNQKKAVGSEPAADTRVRTAGAVSSGNAPRTTGAPNSRSAPAAEREAYTAALNTLESGAAQEAEFLFTAFLSTYPQSSLAPNAEYWLGECFYNQKRYSDAILAFQNVMGQYPNHNKASASLLKIGYAYERLADQQNAVFYLQQLLENYPGSEPEQLARAALNRLR
jgi:tol-pal system protein YbgF